MFVRIKFFFASYSCFFVHVCLRFSSTQGELWCIGEPLEGVDNAVTVQTSSSHVLLARRNELLVARGARVVEVAAGHAHVAVVCDSGATANVQAVMLPFILLPFYDAR